MAGKITTLIARKYAIFHVTILFEIAEIPVNTTFLLKKLIYVLSRCLLSKNQRRIFTLQKLTDMVPTNKIYRSMPPGGLGIDTITWWED
jgi:hypothetical protein